MTRHSTKGLKGMTLTRLSKRPYSGVYRQVWEFRVQLEEAVRATGREIDMDDAANINAACRLEMYAKVLEHHINKGEIPTADVLTHIRAAADFTKARNVAIRRLGLKEGLIPEALDEWAEVDGLRQGGGDRGETISGETDEPKGDET